MKFDFRESAKDHVLIVAHRGMPGGNVPCNTLPAYEMALRQGADIVERELYRGLSAIFKTAGHTDGLVIRRNEIGAARLGRVAAPVSHHLAGKPVAYGCFERIGNLLLRGAVGNPHPRGLLAVVAACHDREMPHAPSHNKNADGRDYYFSESVGAFALPSV